MNETMQEWLKSGFRQAMAIAFDSLTGHKRILQVYMKIHVSPRRPVMHILDLHIPKQFIRVIGTSCSHFAYIARLLEIQDASRAESFVGFFCITTGSTLKVFRELKRRSQIPMKRNR